MKFRWLKIVAAFLPLVVSEASGAAPDSTDSSITIESFDVAGNLLRIPVTIDGRSPPMMFM